MRARGESPSVIKLNEKQHTYGDNERLLAQHLRRPLLVRVYCLALAQLAPTAAQLPLQRATPSSRG